MCEERNRNPLKVIGRLERVDLPEWELFNLKAKIDTGANTSSLHCHQIRIKECNSVVAFKLLDPSHVDYNDRFLEMPVYKVKNVKSSNGVSEKRIIVKTIIMLAGAKIKAQFSLTDRSEMRYPVLIGRKLLKGRFLVDVSRKFNPQ
jgi:hypothetical protein